MGLLAGLSGFMRVGELTRPCIVCVPFGNGGQRRVAAFIAIIVSENRRYMGRHQIASVDEKHVVEWLRWFIWRFPFLCLVSLNFFAFALSVFIVVWANSIWVGSN